MSSVVKYESIWILKLIFENYDHAFLKEVSKIKDSKDLSALDYAHESKNEYIWEIFCQFDEAKPIEKIEAKPSEEDKQASPIKTPHPHHNVMDSDDENEMKKLDGINDAPQKEGQASSQEDVNLLKS